MHGDTYNLNTAVAWSLVQFHGVGAAPGAEWGVPGGGLDLFVLQLIVKITYFVSGYVMGVTDCIMCAHFDKILQLFSCKSTSITFPMDKPPFMGSDLGVRSLNKTPNLARSILAQKLVWPTTVCVHRFVRIQV